MRHIENQNKYEDNIVAIQYIIIKMVQLLIKNKTVISTILTGGVLLGILSAFYLNPWNARLIILNDQGFINLAIVKSLQSELPAFSRAALKDTNDSEIAQRIQKRFSNRDWFQNNLTIEFPFTKSDARKFDLPDQALINVEKQIKPTMIRVIASDNDENLAQRELSQIAQLIINFSYHELVMSQLSETRTSLEENINKINANLSQLNVNRNTLHSSVDAAKDIAVRLATEEVDLSKTQFPTSILVSSGNEQLNILPLQVQIAAHEIELKKIASNIEQLEFIRRISEYYFDRATKGIISIADNPGKTEVLDELAMSAFWMQNLDIVLEGKSTDGWQRSYIEAKKNEIVSKYQFITESFNIQKSRNSFFELNKKYSLLHFISVGIALSVILIAVALIAQYCREIFSRLNS